MAFWDNIRFPYFNMQQLNLDWILTELKRIAGFMPEDGNVGDILMKKSEGAAWEAPEAIDLNINNLPADTEISDNDKLIFYDASAEANRKITPPDLLNSMMSDAYPLMDGTASAGVSKKPARYDHKHPTDTSRQAALSTAQLAAVNSGITAAKVAAYDTIGDYVKIDTANTGNQLVIGSGAVNTVQLDHPMATYLELNFTFYIGSVAAQNRTEITVGVTGTTVNAVFPIASTSGVEWIRFQIDANGLVTFISSSAATVYLGSVVANLKHA